MEAQHSLDWFRVRLGKFTGSKIGDLMKSGRGKDEIFGEAAKTYIYQVAAERMMNQAILDDDEAFQDYINQIDVSSKAMRWGNEQEENARDLYQRTTGRRIVEVGACKHLSIPFFASSPDGFYYDEITLEKGCLEIKCLDQSKTMRYTAEVIGNSTLLLVEPKYFYQCQAHMMCTGAQWCDFVVYNPFQSKPLHVVRITPDNSCFKSIEDRIKKANDIINNLIK